MAKKTKISQDDLETFLKAMEGTKPLVRKKSRITPPAAPTKRMQHRGTATSVDDFIFSEAADIPCVGGEEFIEYKQTGVSNKTLRKLRKGQYNVDAILDLHGKTVDEAITAVDNLLHQCLHDERRIVLIIHGKGHHSEMPILKNKLNQWLREIDVVLAFCSAAPKHGSRGAMYVLLKRSTEENID